VLGRHGKYCFSHPALIRISAFDDVMIYDGYVDRLGEIEVGNDSAFNLNDDLIRKSLPGLFFCSAPPLFLAEVP